MADWLTNRARDRSLNPRGAVDALRANAKFSGCHDGPEDADVRVERNGRAFRDHAGAPSYTIGVGALWLGWRFVRLRERQASETHLNRQLEQRVHFLEESLARMSMQVDQLTQSQEFTSELLEARTMDSQRTT